MEYYNVSFLLTGDIEARAEEILTDEIFEDNKEKVLDVDILKVAHHGSKTSSTNTFLNRVSPSIALISSGIDNKFGHPNAEVIERLKQYDTQIYRTDLNGEIIIKVFKNGIVKIKSII